MSRHVAEHLQGECLLLAETTADAGMLETALRHYGHQVRVIVAPGPDTLMSMLSEGEFIGLVIDLRFPGLRLRDVLRDVRRGGHEIGTLVWYDTFDGTRLREALEAGADGLLSRSDSQLSLMLLERVMRTGVMRKQLKQLRERMGDQARKEAAELESWDGPVLILQEGVVASCNQHAADMLGGGDPDQLIAMPVLDLLAPESVSGLRDAMKRVTKQRSETELQLLWQMDEGEPVSLSMTLSPGSGDDPTMLELRALEDGGGETDSVARDRLRGWLTSHEVPADMHPALVLFGIDDIAQIEGEVGMFGLDALRSGICRLLLSSPLTDFHVAPLDGGVVALTCAASSLDEIREWCSARLRQISRQIFAVGDKQLTTTASVVITALPPPPRDASAALATAGQALVALHAEGNNSAVRITGDAAEELQRREESKRWADQVRLALNEGHFALAFQGVACLTDDPSEYTDVLMRLNDADGKPVQAKEFMPAAQEHGLMGDIDRWVVNAALERLKHLHEQRKRQVFFVRLDIASVQQANAFLQWMEPLWKASGLPTGSIVMVLRERMLQTQMRSGTSLLNGLRSLGVATGIDHFGISSQSAELLRRLPVDYVKLHADFTAAVSNPGADLSSFREIMDVAKQQKIRTIAERVASANDMARLWQMGVNFLMGSHVHEPEAELKKTRLRLS